MNRSTRREAGTNWQTEQQQLTRTGWYLPKNSAGAEDRMDLMANKICNLWLKWAAMLEACRLATVLGLKKSVGIWGITDHGALFHYQLILSKQ